MKLSIHIARVNIKSLAAEAQFIRKEIREARTPLSKACLHSHRIQVVRPESRIAQLALAYLKGMDRKQCENSYKTEVDPVKLFNKLKKFDYVIGINKEESMKKIVEWLGK